MQRQCTWMSGLSKWFPFILMRTWWLLQKVLTKTNNQKLGSNIVDCFTLLTVSDSNKSVNSSFRKPCANAHRAVNWPFLLTHPQPGTGPAPQDHCVFISFQICERSRKESVLAPAVNSGLSRVFSGDWIFFFFAQLEFVMKHTYLKIG